MRKHSFDISIYVKEKYFQQQKCELYDFYHERLNLSIRFLREE